MQGFDHVMLFNDGSIDDSLAEVKPWIDSGKSILVQNVMKM